MKIKLIVLLFIGFVHKNVKSRGIDTGRPPGEAETRMYAIENDHDNSAANEYLTLVSAQENYEKNDKSPSNIQNKFNEMFSSVSYENNQYNKENDNLIIDNKKSQETIDLQTKNRLSEQNTSEDELNAMALHALKDSQTTSHQNSEDKIEPTTTQENSELKRKPHCNSGIDTEAVTKYISTRTVVINDQDMITNDVIKPTTIEKQSTMSTKSTETTKQVTANLLIDVTHDVFSTLDGLLPGIQYKVTISKASVNDVEDFMIVSTISNKQPFGIFTIKKTNFKSDKKPDGDNINLNNHNSPLWNIKGSKNNESDVKSIEPYRFTNDENECEKHIVYHKFNINEKDKTVLNWTTNSHGNGERHKNKVINLRILYRRKNRKEMFERILVLTILDECVLTIKSSSGFLDSTIVPMKYKNCKYHFSPNITQTFEHQSGLLIKFIRLNVPCNDGGYVEINQNISMCGKLEEIAENRRLLYFPNFSNTSLTTFNRPKFNIHYNLVDYCYNTTLLEQNNSILIKPTHSTLDCYFKIHLPYGNRVSIKLLTNINESDYASYVDNGSIEIENINIGTIKKPYRNIPNNDNHHFVLSDKDKNGSDSDIYQGGSQAASKCVGILIEIISLLQKWIYCVDSVKIKKVYKFTSDYNILDVKVTKKDFKHLEDASSNLQDISLRLDYTALSIFELVSQCSFGWILVGDFCMSIVNKPLHWDYAEKECNHLGGHLASIRSENDQLLVDKLLLNSPYYNEHLSFWIGATDKYFEGDFRWTDGLPFSYSKWFPGWQQHENYNRQPNDDGLSEQDCVELRRNFHKPCEANCNFHNPTSGPSGATSLADSFMWNDRDCETKNVFLCERPLIDEPAKNIDTGDCNRTIYLTHDHTKITFTSSGFPRFYPDDVNCLTFFSAPSGYKIMIDFEEFVLEYEPRCSYDYLEMFELIERPSGARTVRNNPNKVNARNPVYENLMANNDRQLVEDEDFQYLQKQFLATHEHPESSYESTNIFQPSNQTYNSNIPPPTHLKATLMPRKICGDWSSKLKLLRYESKGSLLGLRFTSDYSHHFGGFKAKISMKKAASECINERSRAFNASCYIFVSFPEVTWWTARQICTTMGAQLSSVLTPDEHRFLITNIRNNNDYTLRSFYWLGAEPSNNSEVEWSDGSVMNFRGWLPGQDHFEKSSDPVCLGLQWKISPTPMLSSGLYWSYQKCSGVGGYVCKQSKKNAVLIQNQTITGIEGRLMSPEYPSQYASNINFWIKITSPEKSRIIVQFQKFDIEEQNECLYDYVSVQDENFLLESTLRQEFLLNHPNKFMYDTFEDYQNDHSDDYNTLQDEFSEDKDATIKYNNFDRKRSIHSINKRSSSSSGYSINQHNYDKISTKFSPYVRWCGKYDSDMSRFDFFSKSNVVILNFSTDFSIAGEGFSATWRSIDVSACPVQTLTSGEGEIFSPNYPNFLIHELECTYIIQGASGKKIVIEFVGFDIGNDASVLIDLGNAEGKFQPFRSLDVASDGYYVSENEKVEVYLKTGSKPKGKGFKLKYKTMSQMVEQRVVDLSNTSIGNIFHLNYPQNLPFNFDLSQHFAAKLGDIISLELHGVQFSKTECSEDTSLEIYDNYADKNGTHWYVCRINFDEAEESGSGNSSLNKPASSVIFITSYLNTIHVRQAATERHKPLLNGVVRVQSDLNYKLKLISSLDDFVETCQPNPCQFGGKCVIANGGKRVCQCRGHFTGRFCGLNMCEFDPCVFGQCELTPNSFKCLCQTGYIGLTCDQRRKPCEGNPCEGRGECLERKNDGFVCRCHAWWEGVRCEKRMLKIPYKPLSERMLQEPFWLGLITVFVVLAVIGLVWCAKRHFPEKIEKLLAEEADRNRPASMHSHHHQISLREQLHVAGAAQAQTPTATTPGATKSIFGRLGIRKPSILSLSSPQPQTSATARTFSLDDLLRPLPRRTPSPRKKRNNSTPTKKNAAEKKQILQHLVSPALNQQPTLGELIQLSENAQNHLSTSDFQNFDGRIRETSFSDGLSTEGATKPFNDLKLEKKVTFARLLNKMSAEIKTGTEVETLSSALSLPNDVQFRANSVPHSPHSTSSNQGSSSELSRSELALHDLSLRNNRRVRPKVSSADSILAMFKNFATSNAAMNFPASFMLSPTTTPTPSSPQDEIYCDDESSTSSNHTPISFSSGAPDSPVFYRSQTMEVPVLDKSSQNSNQFLAPQILLEIPGNINKCLSPIREMPTPMPSPALTPIMPRPHRLTRSHNQQMPDETISVTFSDDDMIDHKKLIFVDLPDIHKGNSDNESTVNTTSSESSWSERSSNSVRRPKLQSIPAISIDIMPPTPTKELGRVLAERPKDLIIPQLLIQTPSPTKERLPVLIFPGSPPPQRASIGETSGMFPNKQQQKKLMMQYEKQSSLDFPFAPPPLITISANMCEDSDVDFLSPAVPKAPLISSKLVVSNTSGMCYLSPFSFCTRGERAPSEGNLSSSGYSSMASPGPSRCSSNNKLCSNDMDDGSFHIPSRRGYSSVLKKDNEHYHGGANDHFHRFRHRSDSETLSDETLLESNDEGIGTDHLDEKIEEGEIKSAKELEVYIGKELLDSGRTLMNPEEMVTMSQLQLPSIVVQSEFGLDNEKSPVSSRSESPLSDRNTGIGRFSPHFYGKKDQQLPFTDSDGLYDFPSSDGKGSTSNVVQHRKSTGKRRDRKSSKTIDLAQSPSKQNIHLEIPQKSGTQSGLSKYHSTSVARKSPKRRPQRYTPSSSSSTESLTGSNTSLVPSIKLRDSLIENIEMNQNGNVSDDEEREYVSENVNTKKPLIENSKKISTPPKKLSRLKAIGNQIRFLRRLEQALKDRDRLVHLEDRHEDDNEPLNSTKATIPLLSPSVSSSSSVCKMSRQKKIPVIDDFRSE